MIFPSEQNFDDIKILGHPTNLQISYIALQFVRKYMKFQLRNDAIYGI